MDFEKGDGWSKTHLLVIGNDIVIEAPKRTEAACLQFSTVTDTITAASFLQIARATIL